MKTLRHGSHCFTCILHHAFLYLVIVHQMALPLTCDTIRLTAAYYSSIDSGRMKDWVGLVGWLFTHISGHPLAVGRAQDRESSPVEDRRSTTVPRKNLTYLLISFLLVTVLIAVLRNKTCKIRGGWSTVWVKKFYPLRLSKKNFPNGWECLSKILHGYCMFISTPYYKILFSKFDKVMPY